MKYILLQRPERTFIITKSLNQFPTIKAQTSHEIQPLDNYENSPVSFDDMLLSKRESNIDLFSTKGHHNNIEFNYTSESYFHLPKSFIRDNSNKFILFIQTARVSY